MPRERKSKYFWPASAITPDDMALLHQARETSDPRTSISELIARAIRQTYGQIPVLKLSAQSKPQDKRKEAA